MPYWAKAIIVAIFVYTWAIHLFGLEQVTFAEMAGVTLFLFVAATTLERRIVAKHPAAVARAGALLRQAGFYSPTARGSIYALRFVLLIGGSRSRLAKPPRPEA